MIITFRKFTLEAASAPVRSVSGAKGEILDSSLDHVLQCYPNRIGKKGFSRFICVRLFGVFYHVWFLMIRRSFEITLMMWIYSANQNPLFLETPSNKRWDCLQHAALDIGWYQLTEVAPKAPVTCDDSAAQAGWCFGESLLLLKCLGIIVANGLSLYMITQSLLVIHSC